MRDVRVDLAKRDERCFSSSQSAREAAAVFVDALAKVPVGIAEIQNFFTVRVTRIARIENADAARSRTEAVSEPVDLSEWSAFENFQAR